MKVTKRIILLMLACILTAGVSHAEFRFGVKAGANINSLHFNKDALLDPSNSCGFTAGVMAEYMVPIVSLGIDASLMYTRMNNGKNDDSNFGKNFLEIPVNLKYKFGIPVISSILKPYIFTGPAFAIKLDKNTIDAFKTKTCQVAWNVGIGLELIKHLQIQGSYGFGINNIADGKYGITAIDAKLRNNYWTISAAWLF